MTQAEGRGFNPLSDPGAPSWLFIEMFLNTLFISLLTIIEDIQIQRSPNFCTRVHQGYWSVILFFDGILIWFWDQGDGWPHKMSLEVFLPFLFF